MGKAIGDSLPMAIGIALSPVPITVTRPAGSTALVDADIPPGGPGGQASVS